MKTEFMWSVSRADRRSPPGRAGKIDAINRSDHMKLNY